MTNRFVGYKELRSELKIELCSKPKYFKFLLRVMRKAKLQGNVFFFELTTDLFEKDLAWIHCLSTWGYLVPISQADEFYVDYKLYRDKTVTDDRIRSLPTRWYEYRRCAFPARILGKVVKIEFFNPQTSFIIDDTFYGGTNEETQKYWFRKHGEKWIPPSKKDLETMEEWERTYFARQHSSKRGNP